ncbi:MAG: Ig-like domain-containing protein [Chloroflexota bacterium]
MITRRLTSIVLAALLTVGVAPPPALALVPPVATPVVDATNEDVPVLLTLTAADVDGGAIASFQVVGGSEVNGTVGAPGVPNCAALPTCTAAVTFTPTADVSGTGGFSFTATDDQGDTSLPATATITINPVNDDPTAVDDGATVDEDAGATQILVLANDEIAPDTGESLVVTGVTDPPNGTATFAAGSVSYTPDPDHFGADSFDYAIGDGNGGVDTGTVNVTVNGVNDAPTFSKGADETVAEDAGPQTVAGWATGIAPGATNESGQTLTFAATPANAALFSAGPAISATGTLTYTPAANAYGSTSVSVSLQDNGGTANGGSNTSGSQSFAITIDNTNDAPNAVDDEATVAEDAGATPINVLANDTWLPDPAETLTVTGVTQPAGGAVTFTAGGVSFTPNPGFNGATSFGYTISDGHGGTDTATVGVTVTADNDPPTANNDATTILEDATTTTIDVLANDSTAPDTGETLTVTNVGLAGKGTAAIAGDGLSVTYTPNANANGADAFTYTISDGNGGSDTATVSITITAVNDDPTALADTLTVAEDSGTTSNIDVLGNDSSTPDGPETLTVTAVGGASHGTTALHATQGVRYTPAADYHGADSFSYTISDGNGGSATATVNVAVTSVNDPPAAGTDTPTVAEDSVDNVIGVLANDTGAPDTGEVLSVTAVSQPANGTTTLVAGVVRYTPDPQFAGADTFTYTLSDGNGGTDTGTVNVTVTPANDNPTANDDTPPAILEDAAATVIDVLGNDTAAPDTGETLAVTDVGDPAHGTTKLVTGVVRYQPVANYNGGDSFSYTISDGNGGSDTATVTITVTQVNDAPSFTGGADQTDLEDAGAQSIAAWATGISAGPADEAGQTLSFTVTCDNTALFSVQPAVAANGTLTYTPAANANGAATVSVRINDTGGTANGGVNQSAIQTFTITVTAVNDAPSFTKGANQADLEDAGAQSVVGWASAISAGPANESAQTVAFEIASNTNTALFSVQPAVAANGTLTYTPAANANGSATVGVRITDTGGTANGGVNQSAIQTFTITVTAVNDAPAFTKGADQSLLEDAGAQSIAAWATGISAGPANETGQALTFAVTNNTNTALFSVQPAVAADGTLTYTPAANANGSATVTIQLSDDGGTANGGDATSASQQFTITVTAVNDVPAFTKGADQADLEDAGAQTVPGWATGISRGPADEAAQALTFAVTSNTNTALFSVQPAIATNGTLTYTPAANANGSATIEFRLVDDGGTAGGGQDTSATQSFIITVTAVNDAPAFTGGADQALLEDAGAQTVLGWATGISAGPADEAGQTLSFSVTNTNAALFGAQPAVAADGTLTYAPAANANGAASVSVRIVDSGGTANGGVNQSAMQAFTITVTAVNDAPSFTKGADQEAPEDAALQTVPGWAGAISRGPADEAAQVLSFEITGIDDPTLFAVAPAVDPATGTLTYDPATNRTGAAVISIRLVDSGGTANGGANASPIEAFTITVQGANDPPIAANDIATVRLAGPTAIDVRANDSGGPNEAGDPYLITAVREGSRGILTITGGGTGLTYDPIGCTTGSDTFSYTLTDGGGQTDTATVLVTIAGPSAYPVADGPRPLFVSNSTIGSKVPVKLAWCGLTSGTTVRNYRLYQSANGGAFTTVISSTTTASSTRTLSVSPTSYQFRARVVDNKGRVAYGTGPRFRVVRYQDASAAIAYSSGWSRATSSNLSGGSSRFTKSAGGSATFTYTGRSFAIVGTKGSGRGSFNVYVDGVRVTPTAVSTRASRTLYRRVLYQRSMPFGAHTVRIVASGNGRFDLDAILTIAAG